MSFNFSMPTKVISGVGCLVKFGKEIYQFGKSCIIVTGKKSAKQCGALDDILSVLKDGGIKYILFDEVEQNPLVSSCYKAGKLAVSEGVDFIIGIGGGSPLDAAKAVAVYAANPELEQYGLFGGWENKALPIVLIGTTSGTGSEVTPYSVLTRDDNGYKGSFSGPDCYARYAFGDPKYTASMSKHFTLSTALDSISHCIESYFITTSDTVSENFAFQGLNLGLHTLREINDFSNITLEQRERLYLASIYGGLAINSTGTALCHLMSYPLSEEKGVSHGYACSVFLPEFIRVSSLADSKKAATLFKALDLTQAEVCKLIKKYNEEVLPLSYDNESMDRWLKRWCEHRGTKKTAISFDSNSIREIAVAALN